MLELQKFMMNNLNWQTILTEAPYSLKITDIGDERVQLSYMQGISDYSYQLVKEARGIILDKNDDLIIKYISTRDIPNITAANIIALTIDSF